MSQPRSDRTRPTHVVAHVGAFDLASYGDQLYPLVAAHELGRRLDDVMVLPYGPVGAVGDRPGEAPCWALGPWSPARAGEIARRADLVLCGGGEIVQGDGTIYAPFYRIDRADADRLALDRWYLEVLGPAEADCPVAWHAPGVPESLDPATADRLQAALAKRAVVSVRDETSRRTLEAAGVDRDIEVVPDSALLLNRVLPPETLTGDRDGLVASGAYPPADGHPILVVQGNNVLARFAAPLAEALDQLPDDVRVVTVSVSPCHDDHVFADALRQHLCRPSWDVPTSTPLEGLAAAIAGADCYLGVSLHGAITAVAYDVPTVTFDPRNQTKLAAFLDLAGIPERRVPEPDAAVALAAATLADQATPAARAADDDRSARLSGLQQRIDTHFDRLADLLEQRAAARDTNGRGPLDPVDQRDLGLGHLLSLRALPVPVTPLPGREVAALRRPDLDPGDDGSGIQASLLAAAEARIERRAEDQAAVRARAELRSQNADLRGAIAHLEGVTSDLRQSLQNPGRRARLRRIFRP